MGSMGIVRCVGIMLRVRTAPSVRMLPRVRSVNGARIVRRMGMARGVGAMHLLFGVLGISGLLGGRWVHPVILAIPVLLRLRRRV
jgi:hypothetical protein